MKLLAIADLFIPQEPMRAGLADLEYKDISLIVRQWSHPDQKALQQDNSLIEKTGPEGVPAPLNLTVGAEDAEILVVQFAPVSNEFMARLPNLKLICVLRSGVENIDLAAAKARGISVMNTPGRNARAVAEFTVGLLLAEVRNIARCHAAMKQGVWLKDYPNSQSIPELHKKTVGFVGFGYIGHLVADLLRPFGCEFLVYDPYLHGQPDDVQPVELDELLKRSDFISMHARLTPESHHMLGDRELRLMKPNAVIVNTARAGLIDQAALVAALWEKRIQGAALDVFDQEPIPPGDPLLTLDNVTLTPHTACDTTDAFYDSPKLCADHIRNWLAGNADIPLVRS